MQDNHDVRKGHAPIDDLTPEEMKHVLWMARNSLEEAQTLLLRALAVMESAYGCLEWNTYARTEHTDETLALVRRALGERP